MKLAFVKVANECRGRMNDIDVATDAEIAAEGPNPK